MKLAKSSLKGEKTLWEKKKLLVTSNFFFSHSVFKSLVLQTRKNQGLFGKRLNVFLTNDVACLHFISSPSSGIFLPTCSRASSKTLWHNKNLLMTSNFSTCHDSNCVYALTLYYITKISALSELITYTDNILGVGQKMIVVEMEENIAGKG